MLRSSRIALAAVTAISLAVAASAQAGVGLTSISSDSFTNTDSQHKTAVEPDTFAAGSTIVAASQLGRYFDGGSSGIGYSYSANNGTNWTSGGALPGLTDNNGNGGSFNRATDPAVAYDAQDGVWLIISLGLSDTPSVNGTGVVVSRSTDGGATFVSPVTVAAAGRGSDLDKTWVACDNTSTSPFYGNCYATWDDFGHGDALRMSTSTDGGLTWGRAKSPAGAAGLGGQPVVQSTGTVIVPFASASESSIGAFRSTNGGSKWSSPVLIANSPVHTPDGNLRSGPLPSAEIAGDDKVYVAWQNCNLTPRCPANDIVMSNSSDGVHWSSVAHIPIDSGDHFIPGLGVDPSTSGNTTRIGLTYYFYANPTCGGSCSLGIGYVQSDDAGATWSSPLTVVDPFALSLIADTNQGRMVGDYMSTSWSGGKAWPALSVGASAPAGSSFGQDLWVPTAGLNQTGSAAAVVLAPATTTNGQGSAHAVLHSRR